MKLESDKIRKNEQHVIENSIFLRGPDSRSKVGLIRNSLTQ